MLQISDLGEEMLLSFIDGLKSWEYVVSNYTNQARLNMIFTNNFLLTMMMKNNKRTFGFSGNGAGRILNLNREGRVFGN